MATKTRVARVVGGDFLEKCAREDAKWVKMTPGTAVWYRGSFGTGPQVRATVVGTGDKDGSRVVDVRLSNGDECWGYLDQVELA